ncbi:FAD/FMN-containing dehydrogenase [Roseivivax lentus]|uniref:FAD/FMN-containing dehydrogenase n=1 Tax=Roseivivax lentus TaxID=633194 RepID=A0A1N7JVV7_9RHOB|nr:FAD-binding oxidoreductase [Roseivivax lentus]SIS53334.1 FAD/FMN-containing dehydrogenase [Roseivivax lentus]
MRALTRRAILLGSGAAIGAGAVGLTMSDLPRIPRKGVPPAPSNDLILNDASELSPTPVHRHIILTEDADAALVTRIREEMRAAAQEGRPVNIGAARHSMGGQAIPRHGHAITFDNPRLDLDRAQRRYRVHAGARWSDVIAALDPQGFSPQVMQSNNDFGVAATFCVNAHGWAVPFGPMGATVEAIEIVTPDGSLVRCSRTEEPALFAMTMGGYGLTGAIVALEVAAADNLRLQPRFAAMPAQDFAEAFLAAVRDPGVNMAYGRLNVDHARFFEEAFLVSYRPDDDQSDLPQAAGSGWTAHAASRVYRAQLGREWGRKLRWWFETGLGPLVGGGAVTRNSLVNEPVATLDDRDPARTDILHEYFVPPERFEEFLALCRAVIPASYQQFLNVTLRFVDSDAESWLTYAPGPRIAAVMSFSQEKTARAEADMARMTRALIDGMIGLGGTYYLPYRPHATGAQLTAAYPRAAEFAAAKRALDPRLLFRNNLWDRYLEPL